jgi:hypothetical protein
VISENGEIAKIVLEEDVVSRYIKTGTRVALKHILAIGASKGIAAMEKADTRHWTTLHGALRMTELNLSAGTYQVAVAMKGDGNQIVLGSIQVNGSGKAIHTFKFNAL